MAVTGADKPRSYAGNDYAAEGAEAERICLAWLLSLPNVASVEDLRTDPAMRAADVDYRVKFRSGAVSLVEVKSDSHLGKTSNVLFEALLVNHTATPQHCETLGWSAATGADWVLYYAPSSGTIYCCKVADLQRVFQEYTKEVRKDTRVAWVDTDESRSTINVLIPWQYCEDIFTVHPVSPK
jgi:hypothetical protein